MQRIRTQNENLNDDSYIVLSSSTDIFYFYKHCLIRCSKISTRTTLAELAKLFARYLMSYIDILLEKMGFIFFFFFSNGSIKYSI